MPPSRWTPAQDTRIRRLRAEGETWRRIAAELAVTRDAVIERGRRIGAPAPPPAERAAIAQRRLVDPWRPPLPPGHAVSWGAITDGTSLAGKLFCRGNRDSDGITPDSAFPDLIFPDLTYLEPDFMEAAA